MPAPGRAGGHSSYDSFHAAQEDAFRKLRDQGWVFWSYSSGSMQIHKPENGCVGKFGTIDKYGNFTEATYAVQ